MQHMVNKAHTRWVAANLISGHLAHAVGKRSQPGLRIDALTGEWRNGEAGEIRGSELCEPGGLRHQAGGASWRPPH